MVKSCNAIELLPIHSAHAGTPLLVRKKSPSNAAIDHGVSIFMQANMSSLLAY